MMAVHAMELFRDTQLQIKQFLIENAFDVA